MSYGSRASSLSRCTNQQAEIATQGQLGQLGDPYARRQEEVEAEISIEHGVWIPV
jgi:hypothetical protein